MSSEENGKGQHDLVSLRATLEGDGGLALRQFGFNPNDQNLIGTDGGASVGAGDWAGWAETIDYEIVTRIPPEIPRVYAQA